jgi:hypothetical protein
MNLVFIEIILIASLFSQKNNPKIERCKDEMKEFEYYIDFLYEFFEMNIFIDIEIDIH